MQPSVLVPRKKKPRQSDAPDIGEGLGARENKKPRKTASDTAESLALQSIGDGYVAPRDFDDIKPHLLAVFSDASGDDLEKFYRHHKGAVMLPLSDCKEEMLLQLEDTRVPILARKHLRFTTTTAADFLTKDLGVDLDEKIVTFVNEETSPRDFLKNVSKKQSLVEDLIVDRGAPAARQFDELNKDWNVFYTDEDFVEQSGSGAVLSHLGAHSIAHKHPTGFVNYAISGAKTYILWDTTKVVEEKSKFYQNSIRAAKISWKDFQTLYERRCAFLAVIKDDASPHRHHGNCIFVPSFYSHDVMTTGVDRTDHVYRGLVNLVMPRSSKSKEILSKVLVVVKDTDHDDADEELPNNQIGVASQQDKDALLKACNKFSSDVAKKPHKKEAHCNKYAFGHMRKALPGKELSLYDSD